MQLRDIIPVSVFKALGDESRVSILLMLATTERALTVTEIAKNMPIDVSVVSRHLKMMSEAGILRADRNGKQVHYTLRKEELVSRLELLSDGLKNCCRDNECNIVETRG